jgi:hypothetical protein
MYVYHSRSCKGQAYKTRCYITEGTKPQFSLYLLLVQIRRHVLCALRKRRKDFFFSLFENITCRKNNRPDALELLLSADIS